MATQTGVGVIFGTGITATKGIIWGSTKGLNQSEDFTRESDVAETRNKDGDVVGRVQHNLRKTLTITVVPADNDGTPTSGGGIANSDLFLVAPGTTVSILDPNSGDGLDQETGITDGAHLDAASGDASNYQLETCKRTTTNTGEAAVEVTLTQFDAVDVTTTVS